MTIRITSAQRLILSDCVRFALVGWLLTDPVVGQAARRIEYKSTTIAGFQFSQFASLTQVEIGASYHARSPGTAAFFPLNVSETIALANDIELEMATDLQLRAAGLIAAYSPFGQPEVCSRDWRTYVSMLTALGLSIDGDPIDWRTEVHSSLAPFRRAVAVASLEAVAAE